MIEIITIIVPVIGTIVVALIANNKKNKTQNLISEEIEEITNADGSKVKKVNRRFQNSTV